MSDQSIILFIKARPWDGSRHPRNKLGQFEDAGGQAGQVEGNASHQDEVSSSQEIKTHAQAERYWRKHFGGKVLDLSVAGKAGPIPIKVQFDASCPDAYTDSRDEYGNKLQQRRFSLKRATAMDRIIPTIEHPKRRIRNHGADLLLEAQRGGEFFTVVLKWQEGRRTYAFTSAHFKPLAEVEKLQRQQDSRKNNGPLQKNEPSVQALRSSRPTYEAGISPTGSQPLDAAPARDCPCIIEDGTLIFKEIVTLVMPSGRVFEVPVSEISFSETDLVKALGYDKDDIARSGMPANSGVGSGTIHEESGLGHQEWVHGVDGEGECPWVREYLHTANRQGNSCSPSVLGVVERCHSERDPGNTPLLRQPDVHEPGSPFDRHSSRQLHGHQGSWQGEGRSLGKTSQGKVGPFSGGGNQETRRSWGTLRKSGPGVWCWTRPDIEDMHRESLAASLYKAVGPGERWITVKPHGPDAKGAPVLIRENPDGTDHVIGDAGGKLNYLKLHRVKSGALPCDSRHWHCHNISSDAILAYISLSHCQY